MKTGNKNGYQVGKLKKLLLWSFCVGCIAVNGCSVDPKEDTMRGEIRDITMEELQKKISSEETFVLVVTRDDCQYCDEFYDLMDTYLIDHPIKIFDLSIDGETEEEKETRIETIEEFFPSFVGTPNIFYVKEGKVKSQLNNIDNDLTEDLLDQWVNKYELDKK